MWGREVIVSWLVIAEGRRPLICRCIVRWNWIFLYEQFILTRETLVRYNLFGSGRRRSTCSMTEGVMMTMMVVAVLGIISPMMVRVS